MATPCGLSRRAKPRDEIVDVGDVGQDVVRDGQIGLLTLGNEPFREAHAEEVLHDRKTQLARGARRAGGGFDADTWDSASLHVLQQVAVVGGDLDHKAGVRQREPVHHRRDVRSAWASQVLEKPLK